MFKEIFNAISDIDLTAALSAAMWQHVDSGGWNICQVPGEEGKPCLVIITNEEGDALMQKIADALPKKPA